MTDTFTAAELAEGWAMFLKGSHGWWDTISENWSAHGPDLSTSKSRMILRSIPKRVVDLSVLVDSGIDCEFASYASNFKEVRWLPFATTITKVTPGGYWSDDRVYSFCRPRHNHWMAWGTEQGGLKELLAILEGFKVERVTSVTFINYRITGLADGWRYPFDE